MDITEAILTHGAKAVYDAAHRHSAGDVARGLQTVGLAPKNMGDVLDAMSAAYAQMSEADKAIDYAASTATLADRAK